MKKIIIAGHLGINSVTAIASKVADMKETILVVAENIEAKNVINEQFEPEPILFNNYHKEHFVPKIKDLPRNKFIDKPKYNHRKR